MFLIMLALACTGDKPASQLDTAAAVPGACDVAALGLPTTYQPSAAVEVLTDARGVRHLYAQSDTDLFWGAGYQIASDRLFQLDTWRRASRGTLAEVQGEGQLESDLAARVFAFDRYACESLVLVGEARPDDFALVVAYVSGINRRIEEVAGGAVAKDLEFEQLGYVPAPFSLEDVLAIGKRINLGYSNTVEFDLLYGLMTELVANWEDFPVFAPGPERYITTGTAPASASRAAPREIARGDGRLTGEEMAELATALRRVDDAHGRGPGSNNWAVHGDHTDNGRPLIANDPHSGYNLPNTLWQVHLNSADAGGSFDVAGFGFPGVPGVQLGHNRRLAWAATTAQADQTDLWAVTVDDGVADIGGAEVPVTEEEEIVRVLLDDGTVEERVYTVRRIDGYGVLLPEDLLPLPPSFFGGELLVNWVGFQPTDEIFAYFDLDRAEDLDAFEAAVGYQKVGMHNWLGATADGIRYRVHGWVPDRGEAGSRPAANRVLDASDPTTLWTGAYLAPEDLPHLDGSQPYIATANNDPFGHTADNDPTNDDVYYGSFFSPSFRADRISAELERLIAAGPVTVEQMTTLQMDDHSPLADALVPRLDAAVAAIGTDPALAAYAGREDLVAAAARLSAWDRRMTRTSPEAALFRAWQGYLAKRSLEGDLSLLFAAVEESAPVALAKINLLVHQQGVDSVLDGRGDLHMVAALDEALAHTAARAAEAGEAELTWGTMHRGRFTPLLGDDVYIPVDGDESTIDVAECSFWSEGDARATCDTHDGAIFRTVTSFGEDGTPVIRYTVPYGADEDVQAWLDGSYAVLPFTRAEVEASAVETVTLAP